MASKGVVEQINFSAYETGIEKPSIGTRYTLNGNDNSNFKRYQDAFDDSPTNAFIIKTIVNYIIGDGLKDKNGVINPHEYLSKQDLRLIVQDFKVFGSAFPQQIYFNKQLVKIKHTPTMRVGLNIDIDPKSSTYMEVDGFWYCWDYKKKFQYTPRFIPMFDPNSTDNNFEILHIRQLSAEPFFPFPDWFSGLKSAKIEAALIDDAVNHVLHGFQGKTIINVNNGSMMDEEEKKSIVSKVKQDWTGTENSDGVTVSVNDSADEAIVVDTIEPRGRNEQFVTYDETAEIKLQAAHQALNIIFSRPGSNGFSNNADEIAMATKSLYLGVINPLREILLDGLNQVFQKINPACDIDFVNFKDETVISNEDSSTNAEPAATEEGEPVELTDETAKAQAQLKGSVGGVSALLEIQKSYGDGLTDYESAIAMLDIIFGYDRATAVRLLGEPKIIETPPAQ